MLKFYDTSKEMKQDIKKMENDGYLAISINDHNLSVKYVVNDSNSKGGVITWTKGYMSVKELTQNQIDELKSTYLYTVENDYTSADEIPNEVIYEHYSGISFVNDDFSCSVGE